MYILKSACAAQEVFNGIDGMLDNTEPTVFGVKENAAITDTLDDGH
jgi:hypothetical protein